MKKILISAGALAALAFTTPASAANTAQADATVNIVSPLTLAKDTDLSFGTIVGPFSNSVVRVSNAGARNCGTLTCSGTVTAASFTVSGGTASQALDVTVDPSVDMTSGGNTITVDLTTDLPGALSTDASGGATFGVGGTITLPAGQADGLYSGTFNVQVDYQ